MLCHSTHNTHAYLFGLLHYIDNFWVGFGCLSLPYTRNILHTTPAKQVIACHTHVRAITYINDFQTYRHNIVWNESFVFSAQYTTHTHMRTYASIHSSERTHDYSDSQRIRYTIYVCYNVVKYVYCVLFLAAKRGLFLSFGRYQQHCV